jgi:hypothetical protein
MPLSYDKNGFDTTLEDEVMNIESTTRLLKPESKDYSRQLVPAVSRKSCSV